MSYLDKYPNCNGCPVEKYCGTVVSSVKLCHSFNDSMMQKESTHALVLSEPTMDDSEIDEQIEMWDCATD